MGGGLKVVVVLEVAESREVVETGNGVEAVVAAAIGDVLEAGETIETDWHVLEGLKMMNPGRFWPMLFVIQL